MKRPKVHNSGQARLFTNRYLEMLTKGHPLVIWGMYIPLIGYLLYRVVVMYEISRGKVSVIFLGGMVFWTFFEYMAHRFLFHLHSERRFWQRIGYIMHGNHHEFPKDKTRLFMPPVPSLLLSTTIFGVCYLVLGTYALAFFPGFLLGYLLYASMHYAIHAWEPPFRFMQPLWRNHHLHHYRNEELGFGVSSTVWDRIFGTMFDLRKEKEDPQKKKAILLDKKEKETT